LWGEKLCERKKGKRATVQKKWGAADIVPIKGTTVFPVIEEEGAESRKGNSAPTEETRSGENTVAERGN